MKLLSHLLRYLDNVEVFCPNDTCNGLPFQKFPYGVIGSVSAFILGHAVVCGGARTVYDGCIAVNQAQYCSGNAQCITSTGGSLWCTGPKTNACYTYDRVLKKNWILSETGLLTARAYAASVVMPDGRFWVLGGAGESEALQTTEFVTISETGISSVTQGPLMPEPLMSHSAAWVTPTQVLVVGGFSTLISDYTPQAAVYDFTLEQWIKRSWMNPGPRIDASCLNVGIGGQRRVLLAGGWLHRALTDTALFAKDSFHWTFLNGPAPGSDPLPGPLRSSAMIERNQVVYMLGGVACQAPKGRPCKQTNQGSF